MDLLWQSEVSFGATTFGMTTFGTTTIGMTTLSIINQPNDKMILSIATLNIMKFISKIV